MKRVGWCLLAAVLGSAASEARADTAPLSLLVVVSGDADFVTWLPVRHGPFAVPVAPTGLSLLTAASDGAAPAPAVAGKKYARLALAASAAGHYDLDLGGLVVRVDAVEARALDQEGRNVSPKTSHAALSRVLPAELGALPGEDADALSLLLIAPSGVDLSSVEVLTRKASGTPLDVLPRLRTLPGVCPTGTAPELVCHRTPPIRAVADALDRAHPASQARSIRAELGGSLRVASAGRTLLELAVGGPRHTRLGQLDRYRAKLRVLVLRTRPGGAPALGTDDASAKAVVARELATASALWSQCGIELYAPATSIQVVDPPPAQLLSVGCGLGLPASGGTLSVRDGSGKTFEVTTRAGESPLQVAERLGRALGRRASVFENQRTADAMLQTADLLLSDKQQRPLLASSSDPTLPLCVGELDLADGLAHFADGDAFAGTVEERALLRALDDGDPHSIEVLVVPSFARQERIGESFIASPGSSLSNAVIIDRSAIRAGARSFALAHELGHVLMAMPGHPDDFGVDQSWSLMDADVADPTIFGPRRLSIADCERALTQTGPNGLVPLLEPVPLR